MFHFSRPFPPLGRLVFSNALYEEAVAKTSQNQVSKTLIHEIDVDKIEKAQELFNYAKSLIVAFSEWDKKELPNPEEYSQQDVFFIERANGLFV